MSELYRNKYKITSNRLQGYDYNSEGAYFITINTHQHEIVFGDIQNNEITLSEIGKLSENIWKEIPNKFPYIQLGSYVIMPNHVHGILIINKNEYHDSRDAINRVSNSKDVINQVSTTVSEKNTIGGITGKHNPMLQHNISRVIRWYKGRASFEIHKKYANFAWQKNYYDHIIRNQKEFINIENYIRNNPANWDNDKFYNK